MKIQMKVRQCHHLYHLWYVSARTNLRIGTGLEGRVQTYRSGAGQLVQLDMLRQWILLLLQMTVSKISVQQYINSCTHKVLQ